MNSNLIVLIPDRIKLPASVEYGILGDNVELLAPEAVHIREIRDDIWRSADAIIAWHDLYFSADLIWKLDNCKVLVRAGVGFDNVDLRAAGAKGIPVCNVPDYGTNDVADHALSFLLTLARGLSAFNRNNRISNEHWHWQSAGQLSRLTGKTLGIVGLGRIGTAVAMRARAFGLQVKFFDPYIQDGYDKAIGVIRCDALPELLADSDIISMHTPLTDETKGMVNAEFFSNMKDGAVFINTARGPIMDLDALSDALHSGKIRAAGLDVLPQEPPERAHPLIQAWQNGDDWLVDRLIITPHAAFYCAEAYHELREKAALEAKRVLSGEKPRNCVNLELLTPGGRA